MENFSKKSWYGACVAKHLKEEWAVFVNEEF